MLVRSASLRRVIQRAATLKKQHTSPQFLILRSFSLTPTTRDNMADAIKEAVDKAVDGVKNLAVTNDKSNDKSSENDKPQQQKPKKEKKKGLETESGRPLEMNPPPQYIADRNAIFDKVKAEQDAWIASQPREDINVTLASGDVRVGKSWEISPSQIARDISKSLFERTVIARVDGELWDMDRPLEKSCKLELLDFDHPEGKKVFWHSSAHVLGEACERHYGCSLCIGPPVDDGFYYEMALPDGGAVQSSDYKPLEKVAEKAIKDKQTFERLTLTKQQLLDMFAYNKYKQHIIQDKIPDGTSTTVYRCGPLIDLCRGPHIPHTGRIKAFQIMKNSASYFLGDAKNDSLQRIYGVSFPDKKQMDEHKKMLEEAAKRDHRKIGKEQELFFFHEMSPGSCFFLPHGMIIYNALQSFIRNEYWKRGYSEVMSPNMYNSSLWKQSGHWQHYQEDMFIIDVEKEKWGLKPMNCPGHCLVFGHRERSYRELPIRMAEFGILHRNEASGALTGLTRVRRFQQDDTHIFCRDDQIESEMSALFDFFQAVYGNFGLTFKMKLSTRPDNHLGDIATWDRAEARLTTALDNFCSSSGGSSWELNPGDGAFYGPKIDITIADALKREYQCATIQLDFQLPQQFNLEYRTEQAAEAKSTDPAESKDKAEQQHSEVAHTHPQPATADADSKVAPKDAYRRELTPGCARPVMIHRAIYGSFERFIAILTEHFAGKWPFWLSPRQILIVPVMPAVNDYVSELQTLFREKGMHVDIDISGNTMQKKIRTGQLAQYNFIFVVGAQEKESRTVNIRNRDIPESQKMGELVPVEEALKKFEALRDERRLESAL